MDLYKLFTIIIIGWRYMPTLIQTNRFYIYVSLQKSGQWSCNKCRIRNCNSMTINIISRPVQQQLNAFDCGVYPVAYATDLANNIDFTNSLYETQNIWHDLSHCLERGSQKPFSTSDKRTKGMIHIWRPWKSSNFQDPHPPCPSTSKILPLPWSWTSNFKCSPPSKW